MSEIPFFKALGWGQFGDHKVAYVRCDRERNRGDTGLPGAVVNIDGDLYKVIAVERYVLAGPIRPGECISLMVEEYEE